MTPRMRRLEADYRELRARFDADPYIEIQAEGQPPEQYTIIYRVPALRPSTTGVALVQQTVVHLTLGAQYPRMKPIAVSVDPVFHPNFGPHDNAICIADFWVPAQSLADIVVDIGDMLQYKKYNIQSPLNAQAANWTQSHKLEIPLEGHLELGATGVSITLGRTLELQQDGR